MGHVAVGTLADLVLWKPQNFGTKPEMVLKSGVIAWAQVCYFSLQRHLVLNRVNSFFSFFLLLFFFFPLLFISVLQMGDANASIPTVQPVFGRPMWGSYAGSAALNSITFVSELSITSGTIASYGLSKRFEPVRNCRTVKKKDMKWNGATPKMKVDPESYSVYCDGVLADIAPATRLPLARFYNLF